MFGFFDTLFQWFYRDNDENDEKCSSDEYGGVDRFAAQKKVQFPFKNSYNHSFQRRYISRETQTDTNSKREKVSCEVMTDPIDFPISSFETELKSPKKLKEINRKLKYGFGSPTKPDESFILNFTFNNTEKTIPIQKNYEPNNIFCKFDYNDNKNNNQNIGEIKEEIVNNKESSNNNSSDETIKSNSELEYSKEAQPEDKTEFKQYSDHNVEEEEEEEEEEGDEYESES
ncbi:hypothetical protein M9Y10_005438 [Tritrichomonas musculus]|uniref:Uncharacterized protein n=1 Tax=Tritrichomonas musculus TaxID=1915356 RepID=A0ABR2JLY3_9EUKA